jgi:hypothetical protein
MVASETLTAALLVKVTNASDVAKAALPDSNTDETPFLNVETVASGENATLRPLDGTRNVRLTLSGTCNPGAQLVLATPNGTVDGMVVTLPAVVGTYRLIGIAEEAGVDRQLVLVRPVGQRLITVI